MKQKLFLFLSLFAVFLLAGCQGADTLDGVPVEQVCLICQEGRMTLPEQLGRELCSLLEEAGLAGQTDFAGALDQPGTLVFLSPEQADGETQVTFYLISQPGRLPLLVRQETGPDGTVTQQAAEPNATFVSPQYIRWRTKLEEALWAWEAERLEALAVRDFSDPQAIDAILEGMHIEAVVGPFTWESKESPVPGITIIPEAPSGSLRESDFLSDCAPLFLELVKEAQRFTYTYQDGAEGSLEIANTSSKGVKDFTGLYQTAQRHARLPSPVFCPRFTPVRELSPEPQDLEFKKAEILVAQYVFAVDLDGLPITLRTSIPNPIYEPQPLNTLTVGETDLAQGYTERTSYRILDQDGAETGFQLFLLDDAVYLSYLGEDPQGEFLYLLYPEPVPRT